jgi:hypothetical protein
VPAAALHARRCRPAARRCRPGARRCRPAARRCRPAARRCRRGSRYRSNGQGPGYQSLGERSCTWSPGRGCLRDGARCLAFARHPTLAGLLPAARRSAAARRCPPLPAVPAAARRARRCPPCPPLPATPPLSAAVRRCLPLSPPAGRTDGWPSPGCSAVSLARPPGILHLQDRPKAKKLPRGGADDEAFTIL